MVPQARHPDVKVGIVCGDVCIVEGSPRGDRGPSNGWVRPFYGRNLCRPGVMYGMS